MSDNPLVSELIGQSLAKAGYATDITADGPGGLRMAESGGYDLVVLDLAMPGVDERTVLAWLRGARPGLPVLVLPGDDDPQAVAGVRWAEPAAPDRLTGPLFAAVRLARFQARLGRSGEMRAGGLVLDLSHLEADAGQGPVALTRLEFLLLRELAEHPARPLSRDELLAAVWRLDFDPGSNIVDMCVRRLRSKFGFELIKTVRGTGYQLAPRAERQPPGI